MKVKLTVIAGAADGPKRISINVPKDQGWTPPTQHVIFIGNLESGLKIAFVPPGMEGSVTIHHGPSMVLYVAPRWNLVTKTAPKMFTRSVVVNATKETNGMGMPALFLEPTDPNKWPVRARKATRQTVENIGLNEEQILAAQIARDQLNDMIATGRVKATIEDDGKILLRVVQVRETIL